MNCHLAIIRVKFVYLIVACVLRRKLNRRFHNKRRRRERKSAILQPGNPEHFVKFSQLLLDVSFLISALKHP